MPENDRVAASPLENLKPGEHPAFFRAEPDRPAESSGTVPKKLSLTSLAADGVSRGFLAVLLAMIHDPLMVSLLGILCFTGLAGAALARRKRPAVAASRLLKGSIYGVAAMVAYAGMANDRNNIDLVVKAVEEYRLRYGTYPPRLDALVPEQLPNIPRAGVSGFSYSRDENGYWLSYRPSLAGPCSLRSGSDQWVCQAR